MSTDALPTPEEIRADPDLILKLYDRCPKCGSQALEALTWKSLGLLDVTVGCWTCDWIVLPPGVDLIPQSAGTSQSSGYQLSKASPGRSGSSIESL